LKWHKEGCHSVSFAGTTLATANSTENKTESSVTGSKVTEPETESQNTAIVSTHAPSTLTVKQRRERKTRDTHWLAAGSKDGKVSLWDIF
jgi:hypothetical protein